VYAAAGKDAVSILSIHLPANLSAIYTTALKASELVDGPHIQVIDSRTVSMAQGFIVLEAARKAAQGASLAEVVERAREIAGRVKIYVMLDTLEYLHRGGRIGDAAALLGGLLQIKPVVYVLDGQVKPLAKPRTREKGMECMLNEMEKEVGSQPVHAAIVQADAMEEAIVLKQQVAERFDCRELYLTEFTPVMGAHSGPGILGVAFYVENH
jgi:DegV family protein with EDD domain